MRKPLVITKADMPRVREIMQESFEEKRKRAEQDTGKDLSHCKTLSDLLQALEDNMPEHVRRMLPK